MGGIDRRSVFVAAAAAATGAAVLPTMAQPAMRRLAELKKEADIACLYHCDFGDPPRFVQMLQNIANHYSVYGNPLDL